MNEPEETVAERLTYEWLRSFRIIQKALTEDDLPGTDTVNAWAMHVADMVLSQAASALLQTAYQDNVAKVTLVK